MDNLVRTEFASGGRLLIPFYDCDYVHAAHFSHLHEHKPDRSATDNYYRVSDLRASFVQSPQHTGQRLGDGRCLKADAGRNGQHVGLNNSARYLDVLCVGTVIEEQVLAKILLMLGAIEAHLTGRGVKRHHAHALLESANSGANFLNDAGEFVHYLLG